MQTRSSNENNFMSVRLSAGMSVKRVKTEVWQNGRKIGPDLANVNVAVIIRPSVVCRL